MSDIVERLRSMEVFFMESAGISPVAYEAAAAITTLRAALSTARADALEEAARVVTRHYEALCAEHRLLLVNRAAAIRALKEGKHD